MLLHLPFRRLRLRWPLVVAAMALIGGAGAPYAAAADVSPPIVESPRGRITLADYEAEIAKLPPEARGQFAVSQQRLMQLLSHLFLNRAAANDARAAGLDRDPVVARQLEMAADKILAQAQFDQRDREQRAEIDANPDKYLARAREIYLTTPGKFRAPEKVRVSHLLVKVGPDGEAAARGRAEELRAKVVAGAVFADLAREASDDPNAKGNGGDLGFIVAKGVDPAFAAAAFALRAPGALSPVIKGRSGYHVILLRERQPAVQHSFDEVKAAILAEVRQAVVEGERSAYQSALVADPPPKVNEQLIDKINLDARASAPPEVGAPRRARR